MSVPYVAPSAAPRPAVRLYSLRQPSDWSQDWPSHELHDGYLPIRDTDRLFIKSQEPPADWIRALREVSPKTDAHGWLYLHWEAGDPWIPGQRWVLYEMLPVFDLMGEPLIDWDVLEELEGPHPRSEGHMCSTKVPRQFQCFCRTKFEGWRGGPCSLVTLTQYQLYRRTGYYGKPYLILQGDKGGHKFAYNRWEEEMMKLAGLPEEPPAMGDLPYAPFDGRTLKVIRQGNRLHQMGRSLTEYRRLMGPQYGQYKAQIDREMRRQYVNWLSGEILEEADLFASAARKGEFDGERRTEIEWEKVEEASTAHFIETGRILHPSEVH